MDAARNNMTVIDAWAHADRIDQQRRDTVVRAANPVTASYDLAHERSGDVSSVFGIAGAASMLVLRPGSALTSHLISTSMVAGGVDTIIEASRWLSGEDDGSLHKTWYAATGVLPGASLLAIVALEHMPSRGETLRLGLLGANLAVIGYELVTRGPGLLEGSEDESGRLSMLAAFSGLMIPLRHVLR